MDNVNPFGELQQLQLGNALMGQPAVPSPAPTPEVPQLPMGQMPTAAPQQPQTDSYESRVAGWTSSLQELVSNPTMSLMLLQAGSALLSGRNFSEAIGDAAETGGRAGKMMDDMRRQRVGEEMAQRKIGLEERELAARSEMWNAQARNYERMARGEGLGKAGRGGGGGAGGTPAQKDQKGTIKIGSTSYPIVMRNGQWLHPVTGQPVTDPEMLAKIMPSTGGVGGGMAPEEFTRADSRLKTLEEAEAKAEESRAMGISVPDNVERKSEIAQLKARLGYAQAPAAAPTPAAPAAPVAPAAAAPGRADFPSKEARDAAFRSGQIPPGTYVTVNGGEGLWVRVKNSGGY